MNKEFIPYEQALELKELGFDAQCFAHYRDKESLVACNQGIYGISYSDIEAPTKVILAPLYQQVFRWFREKHNLNVFIQNGTSSWMAFIGNTPSYIPFVDEVEGSNEFKGHNTYEEAEQACLDRLIKIVKNA